MAVDPVLRGAVHSRDDGLVLLYKGPVPQNVWRIMVDLHGLLLRTLRTDHDTTGYRAIANQGMHIAYK